MHMFQLIFVISSIALAFVFEGGGDLPRKVEDPFLAFNARRWELAFDLAAKQVKNTPADSSVDSLLELMDECRRRIEFEGKRKHWPSNSEWEAKRAQLSRETSIRFLAKHIFLTVGMQLGTDGMYCPALVQTDIGQLNPDAPVDPVLELRRLSLKPEELHLLADGFKYDWSLTPPDQLSIYRRVPMTREVLRTLVCQALRNPIALSRESLMGRELGTAKARRLILGAVQQSKLRKP